MPESYLGSRTGHWTNAKATTEIRIERVEGANMYANSCLPFAGNHLYDLCADGPTPGALTAEGVTFEVVRGEELAVAVHAHGGWRPRALPQELRGENPPPHARARMRGRA